MLDGYSPQRRREGSQSITLRGQGVKRGLERVMMLGGEERRGEDGGGEERRRGWGRRGEKMGRRREDGEVRRERMGRRGEGRRGWAEHRTLISTPAPPSHI